MQVQISKSKSGAERPCFPEGEPANISQIQGDPMNLKFIRVLVSAATALSMVITAPGSLWSQPKDTATPIKHVVVIFQENVSFDHYFGNYPMAANLANEIAFRAKESTPRANTLEAGGL